jgi:hypothetical protein
VPGHGNSRRVAGTLGGIALVSGGVGLLAVLVAFLRPAPFVRLADSLLQRSTLAQGAFASGQMFLSYEARNFLLFFAFLAVAGAVLLLAWRAWRWWPLAALAVIAVDLFVIGFGFNPRADPKLLDVTPPSITFLQQDKDIFRVATLDLPDQKLLNMNTLMPAGIQDIRGYDSIIPRQYTEYMNLIEGQGELLYNRVAPFYWAGSLDSALVDLLNVKYVVTTQQLSDPKYTLVYDDEVRIYRNNDVLPRAFVVNQARVIEDEAALQEAMKSLDPRREVLLEEAGSGQQAGLSGNEQAESSQSAAHITSYTPNRVTVEADMAQPGYLVLADSYFPGWLATMQPVADSTAPPQDVPILRADYNFRAVALPAGSYEVVFRYSPLSLRVGLLGSILAFVVAMLLVASTVWGRLYHDEEAEVG